MDKSLLTVEWKTSDLETALRAAGIEAGEEAVQRLLSPDRKLLSRIEEAAYACGWKIIYEEAAKLTDKGEESLLKESWIKIQELIHRLSLEPYVDDQLEIDEIGDICEELIKELPDNPEEWTLRRKIVKEIIENEYFDYYGCSDAMQELLAVLCTSKEEWIEAADFMVKLKRSNMWKDGVKIYRRYGEKEKNIDCLKEHLDRESKIYYELILCYDSLGNYEAAEETCRLALEKCKENLTDIFLYLIRSAYKRQDNAAAKKLISRAKLRKSVDVDRLMEALEEDSELEKNS